MDWQALTLSLKLAAVTLLVLLPAGLWLGRWLAYTRVAGKSWIEAVVVLPLVLPPTVLGYYLLVSMGGASPIGAWVQQTFGVRLTFKILRAEICDQMKNHHPCPKQEKDAPANENHPITEFTIYHIIEHFFRFSTRKAAKKPLQISRFVTHVY